MFFVSAKLVRAFTKAPVYFIVSFLFLFALLITVNPVVAQRGSSGGSAEIDWETASCTGASLESLFPGLKGSFEKPKDFFSGSINENVGYSVYLPPSYNSSSNTRYPVVYYLHGSNGNECNYYGQNEASPRHSVNNMVSLVESGQIPETIFVAINGGRGSNYNSSVESMFINELIPDVDARYRTIASREGRAIEGFSMGGFGTAKFAFKYPEMFCTGTIMAGANIGGEMADYMWDNASSIISQQLNIKGLVGNDQTKSAMEGLFGSGGDMDQFESQYGYNPRLEYVNPNVGHNVKSLLDAEGLQNAQNYWQCFGGGSGGSTPTPTVTPTTGQSTPTPTGEIGGRPTNTPTMSVQVQGDMNGDNEVTDEDYGLFLGYFGDNSCGSLADFDNSCVVDIFDLNILVRELNNPTLTVTPTTTLTPTVTPTPIVVLPTPTSIPGGVEPYASAPSCEELGVMHDDRSHHGIWNYENGCHWDHEHKQDPHELDDVFGTEIYNWFGADIGRPVEISYPWQTFAGAYDNFESYIPGTATENSAKHEGNHWLYFRDKDASTGSLLLGAHTLTDARVAYHQVGGQVGAFTRFHSVFLQARACWQDDVTPASQGVVTDKCGTYVGGGWLDLGRLNYPSRGIYEPLPGDHPDFGNEAVSGPPEAEPYRIHATGQNSLDSWQSEGNAFNYLSSDPTGQKRLRVGYGIHFDLGESTGETIPDQYGQANPDIHFWCVDPVTNLITCDNNNSAAALFRTWVTIPRSLDGSVYDQDSSSDGYFSFDGYTNRYGDIVGYTTASGQQVNESGATCWQSGISLDCVPAQSENFPVGGCNDNLACKAAYRGDLAGDLYEADLAEPLGVSWIKYPN